ncbi:MAG: hypothetical protein QXO03_05120 [Thermoplasmatales archaeon]
MMGLFVRKEKAALIKKKLLERNEEFVEEEDRFHTLFLFLDKKDIDYEYGKNVYLVDDSLDEIELKGKTFAIKGSRDSIDKFAPALEAKGMKVDLDKPDVLFDIKRWKGKFIVSVS